MFIGIMLPNAKTSKQNITAITNLVIDTFHYNNKHVSLVSDFPNPVIMKNDCKTRLSNYENIHLR